MFVNVIPPSPDGSGYPAGWRGRSSSGAGSRLLKKNPHLKKHGSLF